MHERDWNRLVQQLRNGECTPFIGSGACVGTLPTGRTLATAYADEYGYPFADRDNLPRVMEYAAAEVGDPVDLKRRLARQIEQHRPPDFSGPTQIHGLLGGLPLPLYLTTNYDNFMAEALRWHQKAPHEVLCRWWPSVREEPVDGSEVIPRADAPVVFHLHGSASQPSSMVLTEEDYLAFLLTLALDQGFDDKRVIPTRILPALTVRPLLFIGYSMQDWSFRVLFQGFARLMARFQSRRHISVQLVDSLSDDTPATRARAEEYLNRYVDRWNISVYWGEAEQFCVELRDRLGSANAA